LLRRRGQGAASLPGGTARTHVVSQLRKGRAARLARVRHARRRRLACLLQHGCGRRRRGQWRCGRTHVGAAASAEHAAGRRSCSAGKRRRSAVLGQQWGSRVRGGARQAAARERPGVAALWRQRGLLPWRADGSARTGGLRTGGRGGALRCWRARAQVGVVRGEGDGWAALESLELRGPRRERGRCGGCETSRWRRCGVGQTARAVGCQTQRRRGRDRSWERRQRGPSATRAPSGA
jgi:hypothetical protein